MMKDKIEAKNKQIEEEEGKKMVNLSNRHSTTTEKIVHRSKKDTLKLKKILKREMNGGENGSISNNDNQFSQNSADEDNSAIISKFGAKKQKMQQRLMYQRAPYSLEKLIIKPPYITVTHGNRMIGDFGHATVVFKRPVIEGHFFMEFVVREDGRNDKKTANRSAVRVGLCPHSFNPSFPLGYAQSIAYKSVDGSIIREGQTIQTYGAYKVGDAIGICMNMKPTSKYPNPSQVSQGSTVTFYKNGQVVTICRSLKQMFYCFAVSLYNYSQVEVMRGVKSLYSMPPSSCHYFSVFDEKILYKDLQTKRLFKI